MDQLLIDLHKAFDKVWRPGLLWKLRNYGINGNFFSVIKSMYENVNYCVKANNSLTDMFESKVGVKQGCNLSPTLFNIYINDLPGTFGSSEDSPITLDSLRINCLSYADDLLLISETQAGLQSCLDKLHCYCLKWKLSISIKKSKVMVFNKSNHLLKGTLLTYNGLALDVVKEYCYLGFVITPNGKFKANFQNLKLKATKALFSLRKGISYNGNFSVKVALDLFDHLIVPILTYGCEIWGNEVNDKSNFLNDVSFSFYRYLLGVSKHAPQTGIIGELGRYPIKIVIVKRMLKYWHSLVISDDILLRSAYLSARCHSKWFEFIQNILGTYSESNIWSAVCNINATVKIIQNNLRKHYQVSWYSELHNDNRTHGMGNKLRMYSLQRI